MALREYRILEYLMQRTESSACAVLFPRFSPSGLSLASAGALGGTLAGRRRVWPRSNLKWVVWCIPAGDRKEIDLSSNGVCFFEIIMQ
jgi:hypothetical protein